MFLEPSSSPGYKMSFTYAYYRPRSITLKWANLFIVPLASWIYIFAFAVFAFHSLTRNNYNMRRYTTILRQAYHRFWFPHHISALIIVLTILVSILELVRLGISHQYLGALYFTPIGLFFALIGHYGFVRHADGEPFIITTSGRITRSAQKWQPTMFDSIRAPLFVYWVLEFIFQAIKVGALANLQHSDQIDDPKYKRSDQITDLAVIMGLLLVLIFLEFFPGQGVLTIAPAPISMIGDRTEMEPVGSYAPPIPAHSKPVWVFHFVLLPGLLGLSMKWSNVSSLFFFFPADITFI